MPTAGGYALLRSRARNATRPISTAAAAIATITAFVVQSAETAGAGVIWWKTDVSRIQWFRPATLPTSSTRNDQVKYP